MVVMIYGVGPWGRVRTVILILLSGVECAATKQLSHTTFFIMRGKIDGVILIHLREPSCKLLLESFVIPTLPFFDTRACRLIIVDMVQEQAPKQNE